MDPLLAYLLGTLTMILVFMPVFRAQRRRHQEQDAYIDRLEGSAMDLVPGKEFLVDKVFPKGLANAEPTRPVVKRGGIYPAHDSRLTDIVRRMSEPDEN